MNTLQLFGFAFLTGIVVSGLTASLCELLCGRPASFWQLIKSGSGPMVMWIFVVTAGPYMLLNDVMAARRSGRIGAIPIAAAIGTAIVWASATGIVVVDLGWWFSRSTL